MFNRENPCEIYLAPSLLSCDFARLKEECAFTAEAGADIVHCDVMDGHFVPNLTFGPPIIKAIKEVSTLPLDVHLMISNADACVDWYIDAGSDLITVHVEAVTHLHRVLSRIKDAGRLCAVSLNPATPISSLVEVIDMLDMVLLMSVNPGFGGQSFIEATVAKIAELKALADIHNPQLVIQVDGGINIETIQPCARAGARCFVAGNAVFKAENPAAAIAEIKAAGAAAIA